MARPPVLRGELAKGGAIELLRELEHKRITGTLRFESDDASGEILLYGGEIAVEQPARADGLDAVDALLDLEGGRYEVHQRLPPLPVSKGDDHARTGSLAVHVPADLMSYCEHAGLSGTLELRHAERRVEAIYDAGELLAIQLDGEGAADLSEVFGWEQGRFRVEIDPSAPSRFREEEAPTTQRPAAPREGKKREDTRQFLRVLEMALVDVIDQSERARSPTRTSPPLPPPPKARPRPASLPAPAPKRRPDDQTVRLIYLGGDPPPIAATTSSTRHVQRGDAEPVLTEARPERRAHPHPEPDAMAKKKKQRTPSERTTRAEPTEDVADAKDASPDTVAADAGAGSDAEPAGADASSDEEIAAPARAASSLDDAGDELPAPPPPRAPAAAPSHPLGAVAWAFGVLLLGVLILAVLARLPPVE